MAGTDEIITIDGPAGAGKTTLARALAQTLGWVYLDTGALYRALALAALRQGVDPGDQDAAEALVARVKLTVRPGPEGTAVLLDGEDVTGRLRQPEVSRAASDIAVWPGVRAGLLKLQRDIGAAGRVVAEGRDMGTVVFPDAAAKFFLSADPSARAKRRYDELCQKGAAPQSLAEVETDMAKRDETDSGRATAPLAAAPDARIIDSTALDIQGVLSLMLKTCRPQG